MGQRELLKRRQQAYRHVFAGQRSQPVVADLARFCHAQTTTHVIDDPYGSAQLEGRRQVWLRIQGHLRLTDDQIDNMRDQAEED